MNRELGVDRLLKKLINKYLFEICIGVMLLAAAVVRFKLAPDTKLSPDYNTYYKEWVEYYRENGIISGLGNAIGDYYVPLNLMYAFSSLIPTEPWVPLSIVAFICELISSVYIFKIFYLLTGRRHHSAFAGVAVLFLPFVAFNGALWKQVDALYTCFLLISLHKLIKQEYRASFVWYGVAFAVKLQAVLFLPIYVILYITDGFNSYDRVVKDSGRKSSYSILEFLWIPVIYLIAGVPEVICQNGLRRTYLSYLYQTQELETEGYGMVSYFPNLYNLGFDDYDGLLSAAALMVLLAVMVIIAFMCYRKRENLDRKMVVYLTIWTAWTCVVLLPGMHERYDYAMLLLLTPFAVLMRKQIIWPMFAANICSLSVYAATLFGARDIISMPIVSIVYVVSYLYVTTDIVKLINGGNREVEA